MKVKDKENVKEKDSYTVVQAITNFISTFFAAVAVIIAVVLIIVRVMGLQAFNVESGSMAPAYSVNTLVLVKEVDPAQIQEGDVITYVLNSDGVLVTHRVIDVDKDNQTFITKGDANNTQDPSPVLWGNMVGKVVFSLPKLGAPIQVLTAEENRTKVIIAIAAFGILSFSWDLIDKKISKLKKKNEASKEEISAE